LSPADAVRLREGTDGLAVVATVDREVAFRSHLT